MKESSRIKYLDKVGNIEWTKQHTIDPDLALLEEQREEAELEYLASIVAKVFLSQKCTENNHKFKICGTCKPNWGRYNL